MVVAALAVIGFPGCTTDNNAHAGGEPVAGQEAVLNITLKNGVMQGSRAEVENPGDIAVDANTVVKNFSVFVFNDEGYCWKGYFDVDGDTFSGDGSKIDISGTDPIATLEVNTTATKVYVIANAGDQTAAYADEADLRMGLPINLSTLYAGEPWATGINPNPLVFTRVGELQVAQTTVTCKFVAARVTVKVDNRMTNWGALPNHITIEKVALINVRGQSGLFPSEGETSLMPDTYDGFWHYGMGIVNYSFAYYPAAGQSIIEAVNLVDPYVYKASSAATPVTSDHYFYVFESPGADDPSDLPTIVLLEGLNADGVTRNYFPVHLASYEMFTDNPFTPTTGILRGKSYDLKITLTGDASVGSGGGSDDPTLPILDAVVNVTLEIAPWEQIPLDREF